MRVLYSHAVKHDKLDFRTSCENVHRTLTISLALKYIMREY